MKTILAPLAAMIFVWATVATRLASLGVPSEDTPAIEEGLAIVRA